MKYVLKEMAKTNMRDISIPKVFITLIPKPFNMTELEDKYPTKSYYSAAKSILRKLNQHLKMDDIDKVYPKVYNDNYEKIVEWITKTYKMRSHGDLTSKLTFIKSALERKGFKSSKFSTNMGHVKLMDLEVEPKVFTTKTWAELQIELKNAIDRCMNRSGKALATCYLHGYMLRCGEIFNTCTNDLSNYNYLDLNNKVWHIRSELTKNKTARKFDVTDAFVADIKKYVNISGFFCCKVDGDPYTVKLKNLRLVELNNLIPDVSEMRNIYEDWNWNRTDVSHDTKAYVSVNVLGHSVNTAIGHYTKNNLMSK
jgi:hypothetical protein